MKNENCSNHSCETQSHTYAPLADIALDPSQGSYRIVLDIPGVSEENLTLKTEDQTLTISAKISFDSLRSQGASGVAAQCEAPQRSYHRVFRLSDDVDVERISAFLDAGVLTIELPKQAHKQPRKIPVRVVQ